MTGMHKRLATLALLGVLVAPLYVHAEPCKLEISGNDQMQYDKHEFSVNGACTEVTLTLRHTGKLPKEAMGHNWVLVNGPDLDAVANAGMNAGLPSNYVAAGDKRVLAHTKVVGGGETTSVTFPTSGLKKGGDYKFLCTFPGHHATMRGTFKFG
jgi:azurin